MRTEADDGRPSLPFTRDQAIEVITEWAVDELANKRKPRRNGRAGAIVLGKRWPWLTHPERRSIAAEAMTRFETLKLVQAGTTPARKRSEVSSKTARRQERRRFECWPDTHIYVLPDGTVGQRENKVIHPGAAPHHGTERGRIDWSCQCYYTPRSTPFWFSTFGDEAPHPNHDRVTISTAAVAVIPEPGCMRAGSEARKGRFEKRRLSMADTVTLPCVTPDQGNDPSGPGDTGRHRKTFVSHVTLDRVRSDTLSTALTQHPATTQQPTVNAGNSEGTHSWTHPVPLPHPA